jgi:hypothetical protein
MVEVRPHVHGKYPVSEFAAALSEVDGVASVLAGNDQAADDWCHLPSPFGIPNGDG